METNYAVINGEVVFFKVSRELMKEPCVLFDECGADLEPDIFSIDGKSAELAFDSIFF